MKTTECDDYCYRALHLLVKTYSDKILTIIPFQSVFLFTENVYIFLIDRYLQRKYQHTLITVQLWQ